MRDNDNPLTKGIWQLANCTVMLEFLNCYMNDIMIYTIFKLDFIYSIVGTIDKERVLLFA